MSLFMSSGILSALAVKDVVGFWSICYRPGMEGVSEPDDAMLSVLPGGTYMVMYEVVLGEEMRGPSVGTWRIEGEVLILTPDPGSPVPGSPSRLALLRNQRVRLWLGGEREGVPVLTASGNLNYAWGRVLPVPEY